MNRYLVPLTMCVAVGCVAALVAPPVMAVPVGEPRSVAPTAIVPTCDTLVVGVTAGGRMVHRLVRNVRVREEKVSAPLPMKVESLTGLGYEHPDDGSTVAHYYSYARGTKPRRLSVAFRDGTSRLTVTVAERFRSPFSGQMVANSGSYFVYGLNVEGDLTRWTRYKDNAGRKYLDEPVVLLRKPGIKVLHWGGYTKRTGVWSDTLFATTKAGALKLVSVPWSKPRRLTTTVIRRTGFADYTAVAGSFCGQRTEYLSMIYVDRAHNRAFWYTFDNLPNNTPDPSDLIKRRQVAPGANWRLHAVC